MRKVSGFTLIELVAVIAILAILAVTALPKFFDLRQDAANASVTGIGGSLSSASTINYAKRLTTTAGFSSITACAATDANLLLPGGLPTGYTISGAAGIANGAAGTCVLTAVVSGVTATATFVIFGAS
jgi:MSHA pilin protein MshA